VFVRGQRRTGEATKDGTPKAGAMMDKEEDE
jgi:hypothetical protein